MIKEITYLNELSELNKYLSLSFSIVILSLAEIPPLFGFYTKYLILTTLTGSGQI